MVHNNLKTAIISLLLAFQLLLLIIAILKFTEYFPEFYMACLLLSVAVVLMVINSRDNPSYKLALVIPIMLFPVFGGLFYLLFGRGRANRVFHADRERLVTEEQKALSHVCCQTFPANQSLALHFNYIRNNSGYPAYENTECRYFDSGEAFWRQLKAELESAQRYIFLEYFIIAQGRLWDEILDILLRKVSCGVEVRIIYDGLGCVHTLPRKYNQKLNKMGIRCQVYNPFIPVASIWHNIRDHRKIVVIDGHTAFTGGINLADEYVNSISLHGHWKDSGLMLKGAAAWSFAAMFLSLWCTLKESTENYADYLPRLGEFTNPCIVQPFSDIPSDQIQLGRDAYLNMISRAEKYIYIMTPYLIIDNETQAVLSLAAKSGVKVCIITPHIGDSWLVHLMTRSYYQGLIENGVSIYEYTPGFVHAKSVVCDDKLAVCGSINFDYRSFYWQLECAVLLHDARCIADMKADFEGTLARCRLVSLHDCYHDKWYNKFLRMLLSIFAPLM